MNNRKTLLAAALAAGVMASACVQTPNESPSSAQEVPSYAGRDGIPSGQNAIPSTNNPQNPNESRPFVQQPEGVRPQVRGDNPNLPNPVTPRAANESAAQPALRDPTNSTGMDGRSGTR